MYKRQVQNELTTLSHCNYLVHSAMILSGDGNKACTLYSSSLQRATDELFDLRDLETVNGITLLPRRPSPLRSSVSVIPLIFPLSINAEEYAQLTLDGSTPDVYVILYLDCGKLEESLLLNGSGQTSGVFYLMNQSNIALKDVYKRQLFSHGIGVLIKWICMRISFKIPFWVAKIKPKIIPEMEVLIMVGMK